MALEKAKSLYGKWKEARRTFEQDDFDVDVYLSKQQIQFISKHTTIAKSRDDFKPANAVLYNSAGLSIAPEKKRITKAYDFIRTKNKKFNVGVTPYKSVTNTFNPLEVKNLKASTNVKNNTDVGINVLQANSDHFDFNIDVASCHFEPKVSNPLFSPVDKNLDVSMRGQCSAVEATLTAHLDPMCVGNTCLECEGTVSGSLGEVSVDFNAGEPIKKIGMYGVKANGNCKVTHKPK